MLKWSRNAGFQLYLAAENANHSRQKAVTYRQNTPGNTWIGLKMSGGNFFNKVRSAFRKEPDNWDLSDTAPFDFSDELVDDEAPKFNKLKVVVSGEMSDYSAGAPSNGVAVNTLVVADDDDSLLESSSSLGSPGLNMDPCDNCNKKREKIKHKKVMKRLVMAAVLYFLFMTGEIIGECVQILSLIIRVVTPPIIHIEVCFTGFGQ